MAQERHDFAAAETWYRKALAIELELTYESKAANTHSSLGILAEKQQDYEAAEACYHEALAIHEKLGAEDKAADVYQRLGQIAERRRTSPQQKHGITRFWPSARSWQTRQVQLQPIAVWEPSH